MKILKAKELIENNTLANIGVTGDTTVVFTEIALTAVKLARVEGANNLIEQSIANGQKKYQQGMDFMKCKAIESYIENCEYKSDWCCGCAEAHGAILAEPDVCRGKDCPSVKLFIEKLNS